MNYNNIELWYSLSFGGLFGLFRLHGIVFRSPDVAVEVFVRARGLRVLLVEELDQGVNAHLTNALVVSRADVNHAIFGLLLACHQDVVPLGQLGVPNLLVQLVVRAIHVDLEACSVEVEHD